MPKTLVFNLCLTVALFGSLYSHGQDAALSAAASHPSDMTYDVVVVGAGTGGVAASIQAARQGVRVALLEETDWIGGQMTAGAVGTIDDQGKLDGPQGIYSEFRKRIDTYYSTRGKAVGTCYYADTSHCYEPSVAQAILRQMIQDVNTSANRQVLDVYLRKHVVKVITSGRTITGVTTQDGTTFHATVVIDATEYGDVIPLTPAEYRIGNSKSTGPIQRSCVQLITYVAIIKKYLNGVPEALKMHDAPPGYDDAFVTRMKQVLTLDGNSASRTLPVSFTGLAAYRALPDSSNPNSYSASNPFSITKTSLNWFNDAPASTDIFDRAKRKQIVCAAKLKTIRLLYYIQHELKEDGWSVADDEGFDTPYNREENSCDNIPQEFKAIERNLPVIPYVRESQRIVGIYTLTSLDMRREGDPAEAVKQFPSSIGLGDYANDLHGCGQESDLESDLEHAEDLPGPRAAISGPFQVPMEALIPRTVDGFLAAEKNISQTRLASGGTRLQPITMVTGQAAGALAALAVELKVAPRDVPIQRLQQVLLAADSSLALENLTDANVQTDQWRAAQFAIVHGWIYPRSSSAFGFHDMITRRQLAQILANVFLLLESDHQWIATFGHSAVLTPEEIAHETEAERGIYERLDDWKVKRPAPPSFKDVPSFSTSAAAISEVARRGAMFSLVGGRNYFVPDSPATQADLVNAIRILSGQTSSARAKQDLRSLETWDKPVELLKGNAAEILYWFGTKQDSWPVELPGRLDVSPNSAQVIQ